MAITDDWADAEYARHTYIHPVTRRIQRIGIISVLSIEGMATSDVTEPWQLPSTSWQLSHASPAIAPRARSQRSDSKADGNVHVVKSGISESIDPHRGSVGW